MGFIDPDPNMTLGDPDGPHIELDGDEAKIVLYNEFGTAIMVFDGTTVFEGDTFAILRINNKEGQPKLQLDQFQAAISGNLGTHIRMVPGDSPGQRPRLELRPVAVAGVEFTHGYVEGRDDAATGAGSLVLASPIQPGREPATLTLTSETATTDPATDVVGVLRLNARPVGDWITYAAAWTANSATPPANGTITTKYVRVGKTVTVSGRLLMGATTTYGVGFWIVSLPFPAAVGTIGAGAVVLYDADTLANRTTGACWLNGASTLRFTCSPGGDVSATAPFVWASGDQLRFTFTYETDAA